MSITLHLPEMWEGVDLDVRADYDPDSGRLEILEVRTADNIAPMLNAEGEARIVAAFRKAMEARSA